MSAVLDAPAPTRPNQVSFCVVCDAYPGECSHGAHRYLRPITYAEIETPEGTPPRWALPDLEQWRRENPSSTWPKIEREATHPVMPLPELLHAVGRHAYVDDRTRETIEGLYHSDPAGVTALVAAFTDGATSGRIRNPGGFLFSQLLTLSARRR